MANREYSDRGSNDAYNEMISEEDADNLDQEKYQVYMSMLDPGAGLRRPRLLALSLALLAAVLLLVDIGLGVYYSKLTDGHITFDDVTLINNEMIRLQDDYKIAMESMMYANKQLTKEVADEQLSKWSLEHQMKRKTDSEAQADKLQQETKTLQTQLTMTSEGCRRCLPGWLWMNSLCYYFPFSDLSGMKTWQQARDFCIAEGGDLATIDNSEKQVAIVKLLQTNVDPLTPPKSKSFWIGLRDVHQEGTWKWLNGRTLVEGYWNDGEPNDAGDEDCASVFFKANPFKAWNDYVCRNKLKWICEMTPRSTS